MTASFASGDRETDGGPRMEGVTYAAQALTPAGPARWPADNLIAVAGHPELEPSVTGIVLRRRPHAGPVRAAVGADADQVYVLGCKVVLEQHEGRPVPAGEPGPDLAGGPGDGGSAASLGDGGHVPRRIGRNGPDPRVRDALPARTARWVPPGGSSATSSPSGGRSAGAGVRACVALAFPAARQAETRPS
jgi:hypothetical protein